MRTFVVYSFYFYICFVFIFYIAYGALSLGLIGYARAKFDGHYDSALRLFRKAVSEGERGRGHLIITFWRFTM